jgi:serine/threonine-protein kinase
LYYLIRAPDFDVWQIITFVCIAFGLLVYFSCRTRRIPARAFANVASAFEVVAAIGIMAGVFGWEHFGEMFTEKVAQVLGVGDAVTGVVQPLDRESLRILYHDGVTWVSVWLLVFPLIVPAPMRRTVVTTLLTASTVPLVMLFSLLVNGIPPSMRTWVTPYIVDVTIPTYICAGIAIFGSRVVYQLTRDLSKARQMGSYQLVEKIGAGGMGEVWKAKHRLLVRPAAIKLIRSESIGGNAESSRTALQRFELEAQATSKLSSPHSIELYDFGITDDGTFFYVMELLQGINLRALVERHGPIPAERTIHVLRQVCHSLTDAHLTGVVHRDIKPANIFLCRRGPDVDFVKVLDFGLVKRIGEAAPHLTMEGVVSGTPAFMAPEMAIDQRSVDGRADLYAVGCVAYWLLTGHLVFEGDSPMSLVLQHAKDPPPAPSTRTELEIPAMLEGIVMSCLEKDVRRRPQSARELSDALMHCERSLPPWTQERAQAWWQTHLPHLVITPAVRPAVMSETT